MRRIETGLPDAVDTHIRKVACARWRRMGERIRHLIDLDDLIQAGVVGALEAMGRSPREAIPLMCRTAEMEIRSASMDHRPVSGREVVRGMVATAVAVPIHDAPEPTSREDRGDPAESGADAMGQLMPLLGSLGYAAAKVVPMYYGVGVPRLTLAEIAAVRGVSKQAAHEAIGRGIEQMRRAALAPRRMAADPPIPNATPKARQYDGKPKLTTADLAEVRRLAAEGVHAREIAKRFDVTPQAIAWRLRRAAALPCPAGAGAGGAGRMTVQAAS